MRRYGGGILYATLPLHMQRGCFRIRTHDQQVTKAQLYRCTRARPQSPKYYVSPILCFNSLSPTVNLNPHHAGIYITLIKYSIFNIAEYASKHHKQHKPYVNLRREHEQENSPLPCNARTHVLAEHL